MMFLLKSHLPNIVFVYFLLFHTSTWTLYHMSSSSVSSAGITPGSLRHNGEYGGASLHPSCQRPDGAGTNGNVLSVECAMKLMWTQWHNVVSKHEIIQFIFNKTFVQDSCGCWCYKHTCWHQCQYSHIYTQCCKANWVAQCSQENHVRDWLPSPSLSWKDCGPQEDEDHAQSCNDIVCHDMTFIPMVTIHFDPFCQVYQFGTLSSTSNEHRQTLQL